MFQSSDGRKKAVLVVDDEPILRMSAADMFHDAGYEPIEAANADEAVLILESRDDVCFLFTDIEMPGTIDGMTLAMRVRDRWPPMHIIVTSGHVPQELVKLPAMAEFIAKPYRGSQISAMMARMAA